MRSLLTILESGRPPNAEDEINIRLWLRQYPHTDMAKRLAEKYPHLVGPEIKRAGQR